MGITIIVADNHPNLIHYSDLIHENCNSLYIILNEIKKLQKINKYLDPIQLPNFSETNQESISTNIYNFCSFAKSITSFDSISFFFTRYIYNRYLSILNITSIENYIINNTNSLQEISFVYWVGNITIVFGLVFLFISYIYFHNKKKIWYYGANILLRRAIKYNFQLVPKILDILPIKKDDFLNIIPLPSVICRNNQTEQTRIILSCNLLVAQFTNLYPFQLIGQDFNRIFNQNFENKKFEFSVYHSKDIDIELILIVDVTETSKYESFNYELNKSITPKFKVPFYKKVIYFKARIRTSIDPEILFQNFDDIEKEFNISENKNNAIKRISCALTFYSAIISKKCMLNNLLEMVSKLNALTQNKIICAITFGKVSCFSLLKDDTNIVIGGVPVERAHRILCNGDIGMCYIDYKLVPKDKLIEDNIILISNLKK